MSRSGSLVSSYNLRNLVQHFNRYRSWSCYNSKSKGHIFRPSPAANIYSFHLHQALQLYSANSNDGVTGRSKTDAAAADINMKKDDIARSPAPTPPRFSFPNWLRWFLGSIFSLLLPIWKQKWEKLKMIEGEAEVVVDEVEHVAEVVEKVANMAEKVSADMAEKLPDNSKLKDAALLVENVSKATAHEAQLTIHFIQKVDELKQDLNDLDTFIQPVVDKIVHTETAGK